MSSIRVLLADDHETVRQGLRMLIDDQPDMSVVAEACDGLEAADKAKSMAPDVVVIDLSMPRMNGLRAARVLRDVAPSAAVVALTRHGDDAYVRELLNAGALGYVLKQSASVELLEAIRVVAAGRQYLDRTLAERRKSDEQSRRGEPGPTLTDRETDVLRRLALGYSNKEIANALDLSVKTVEVHRANSMRKLKLLGRVDIIRFAVLQGWLSDP